MPWERLQEGPEDPVTEDLDGDILLSEGRPRNQAPRLELLLRQLSTVRRRYWIVVTVILLIVTLIPVITVMIRPSHSDPQGHLVHQPLTSLPETSTPFLEPFDFDTNGSDFSPPESFVPMPLLDFLYDYITIMQHNENATLTTPLQVTVFYESLDKPSREFLAHQFFPTYFNSTIPFVPKLVPFGHADLVKTIGHLDTLKCEHLEDECQGNMVQGCALRHTNWNQTQSIHQVMRFIQCVMADTGKGSEILNTAADSTGIDCAKMLSIDWDRIYNCTQSAEGITIMVSFEHKTESVLKSGSSVLPVVQVEGYGILTDDEKKNFGQFIEGLTRKT